MVAGNWFDEKRLDEASEELARRILGNSGTKVDKVYAGVLWLQRHSLSVNVWVLWVVGLDAAGGSGVCRGEGCWQ
jgi:hypothetical protein